MENNEYWGEDQQSEENQDALNDGQTYDDYKKEMQGLKPEVDDDKFLGKRKFELFLLVDEVVDLVKCKSKRSKPKLVWVNKFGFTIIKTTNIKELMKYLANVDIEELIQKNEEYVS